jgi:hypothetical protein
VPIVHRRRLGAIDEWGKRFRLLDEPRFTLSLAGFLLAGFAIAQTGVDPIELTEYA